MPDTNVRNNQHFHTSIKPQHFENFSINDTNHSKIPFIIPALDLIYGGLDSTSYRTGLGFSVQKSIGDKFYVRSSALFGLVKSNNLIRTNAYFDNHDSLATQYIDWRARLIYKPNKVFSFQAGIDQNFIGEGCRSLFLSDYGKPYPFALIRANFWKLDYSVLYQFFHEKTPTRGVNKYAATHYLSYNVAKWLNIGVFETVIFQPKDSSLNRRFEPEYLNPFIFYRPQEYSLGSADNVLLGLNLSSNLGNHIIYGQILLDEFLLSEIKAKNGSWTNKFGVQFGVKGKVLENFTYRLEGNIVRPYTYAHSSVGQNYGNKNTALAHPFGANFAEILAEIKWKKDKFKIETFLNYTLRGSDSVNTNYGSDIYKSYNSRPYENGHYIGQIISLKNLNSYMRINYTILPKYSFEVFIEQHIRLQIDQKQLNFATLVGLRTNLWNDYHNY